MIITPKTNKDEVISSACELVDSQQTRIQQLTEERRTIFGISFLLSLGYFL